MKRFCAALISVLFILLCGCTSPADLLSGFGEKLTSNINKAYNSIGEVISEAITNVVEESTIEKSEIIVIVPDESDLKSAGLKAYRKLTSKQRKLYSVMLKAVRNMVLKNIDVTNYVSENSFSDSIVVHRALICDNPDIFWMPKKISFLSVKGRENKYIVFKDYRDKNDNSGFYGITKAQKNRMQKRLDSAVDAVVSKTRKMKSLFKKELFLHDYLCENVKYENESAVDSPDANPNVITAYGALVEGKAICEGYSKAMQLLCHRCGIPCSLVYGEHGGVAHMWNIVNPGDGLYYVDTTFDDSSDEHTLHIYFNVTKKALQKDHLFDAGYSKSKIYDGSESFNFFDNNCKSTFSNYYERNGAYIEEDCVLALSAISRAINSGKNSVELKNTTNRSLKSAFSVLCKKARGTAVLKYCYYYDGNDVLIVVW